MRQLLCPRCKNPTLVEIGDGIYRCTTCGYVGSSTFEKSIFKKGKK